jgi:hypothetical protein
VGEARRIAMVLLIAAMLAAPSPVWRAEVLLRGAKAPVAFNVPIGGQRDVGGWSCAFKLRRLADQETEYKAPFGEYSRVEIMCELPGAAIVSTTTALCATKPSAEALVDPDTVFLARMLGNGFGFVILADSKEGAASLTISCR